MGRQKKPQKVLSKAGCSWLVQKGVDVLLTVGVRPNAKETRIIACDQQLEMALAAPPVDGEANLELVAFIARVAKVGKGRVELVKGGRSRQKTVLVRETQAEFLEAALRGLI